MPTVAPTSSDDEDDTSRLFWVPARIHPELAPKEFKSFLDSRVSSMKRRSGDSSLSADGPNRHGSGGGLRRKKSMLSRQIDNSGGRGAEGYTDGAERLERKRSSSAHQQDSTVSNLQELEVLVSDPAKVIQRLSLDTEQHATGGEVPASEDMPILPAAPPGHSLRRSTRTTYRRGSLRKGERVPLSRRAAKAAETDAEDSPVSSPITGPGDNFKLSRVQTEPMPTVEKPTENFSRLSKPVRSRALGSGGSQSSSFNENPSARPPSELKDGAYTPPVPKHFVSSFATNGRSSLPAHVFGHPIPQIVETPPPPDEVKPTPSVPQQAYIPERISSHEPPPPSLPPQGPSPQGPTPNRGPKRPVLARQNQSINNNNNQTLNDMASHPSPLPGNSTRTDSLSFIPTLTEEKKPDAKKGKDKKEKEGTEGVRKSSWSWGSLLGSEEKEKEKRKEEEKKVKTKLVKPLDKSHDNTRLDLLQTTVDGGRGRESLVLDRGDVKLEEERKKESSRKTSGGEAKKEKDSGLFSSFFGGGKKKTDRESVGKKISSRNLSPDPPHRLLKPDVDYNWTRFSLLEERAIYRMAHIKLANPRRALYSQVLLSNFMYSYLAKVQKMNPQIQVPQSAAQKQKQRQQAQQQAQPPVQPQTPQQAPQRKPDQPEEYTQYQKYQDVRTLKFPIAIMDIELITCY